MRRPLRALLLLAPLALALAPRPVAAEEVLVFAAASTVDVLPPIAEAFTKETGHVVRFSFAGSSTLARQILAGAPADLFLSADEGHMDLVARVGRLREGTRRDLLTNELVVVVPADSKLTVGKADDLLAVKRLALADPTAVPAGIYAAAWLEKRGVWSRLAPRILPTLDVRAALAAVAAEAADAGLVYRTDAAAPSLARKIRVAYAVPASETPRIAYPIAALAGGRSPAAALAFARFLAGASARAVFERAGFGIAR